DSGQSAGCVHHGHTLPIFFSNRSLSASRVMKKCAMRAHVICRVIWSSRAAAREWATHAPLRVFFDAS
ncbi:MAG TPA: hypothetical protein PL187_17555, partial [Caldilinea sp.]|nr:hypothetical protein [Caldilinea sp.]